MELIASGGPRAPVTAGRINFKLGNQLKTSRRMFEPDERGAFSPTRPLGLGQLPTSPLVDRKVEEEVAEDGGIEFRYSGKIERTKFSWLPLYSDFTAIERFDRDGNLIESRIEYSRKCPAHAFRLADGTTEKLPLAQGARTSFDPVQKFLVTIIDQYDAVFVSTQSGHVIADSISFKGSLKLMDLYPALYQGQLDRFLR